MYKKLHTFLQRPEPFVDETIRDLWTRPHLAQKMLQFHLDESTSLASRKPKEIAAIVRWVDAELQLKGKRICDLGCGPGLYCREFAARGAQVVGVDFSSTAIDYARRQLQKDPLPIEYQVRDYLRDELPQQVDIVTLIYFDYCAIAPDLRIKLLRKVGEMLPVGGYFIFDVLAEAAFADREEAGVIAENLMNGFWSDSNYVGLQQTFLYAEQLLSLDRYLIVEETGSWQVFNWLQHFTPDSISRELEAAGFAIESITASLSGETLQAGSTSIGLIAKKK